MVTFVKLKLNLHFFVKKKPHNGNKSARPAFERHNGCNATATTHGGHTAEPCLRRRGYKTSKQKNTSNRSAQPKWAKTIKTKRQLQRTHKTTPCSKQTQTSQPTLWRKQTQTRTAQANTNKNIANENALLQETLATKAAAAAHPSFTKNQKKTTLDRKSSQ